ncbi:hypothetical protein ABE10_11455 [Bacillus toyonensis]|nr:hypothetical protein [Bacillus toyonensis]
MVFMSQSFQRTSSSALVGEPCDICSANEIGKQRDHLVGGQVSVVRPLDPEGVVIVQAKVEAR